MGWRLLHVSTVLYGTGVERADTELRATPGAGPTKWRSGCEDSRLWSPISKISNRAFVRVVPVLVYLGTFA